MPSRDLRHRQGDLSSKIFEQLREELQLIQLVDHTLFLSRGTKTYENGHIDVNIYDIQ